MKKFGMIGFGYIATRHLDSIKSVNGDLVAIFEPNHDVVGAIDSRFPHCKFYRNYSEFKKYVGLLDYLVIVTPTNKHYFYCKDGRQYSKNIICEKPLTNSMVYFDKLMDYKNIYNTLQYRASEDVKNLKECLGKNEHHYGNIVINSYRGDWYEKSWKFNKRSSGGVAVDIGIHVWDMLTYLFGPYVEYDIIKKTPKCIELNLTFDNADIYVKLSVDGLGVKRIFKIGDLEVDLQREFTQLHGTVYKRILDDDWYSLEDVRDSYKLAYDLSKERDTE